MGKKGFTLIELLAVILILAVISIIITPVIIKIVQTAKNSAYDRSVENYVELVKLSVANYQLNNALEPGAF